MRLRAKSDRKAALSEDQWQVDSSMRARFPNWPKEPLVFGALSLDQRGQWHIYGDIIRHADVRKRLNHHYHADNQGRWYFQNGPQRLYVDLAYTPWVFHLDRDSQLRTQTGHRVQFVKSVWLDENGAMIFDSEHGPGLLREDALFSVLEKLCDRHGKSMCGNPLDPGLALYGQPTKPKLYLAWGGRRLPVGWIHSRIVGFKFKFIDRPGAFTVA